MITARSLRSSCCGAPVCSQSQLCAAQQSWEGHSKAHRAAADEQLHRCNEAVPRPYHLLIICCMHMLRCSCCQMRAGMELPGAQRRSAGPATSWCTATATVYLWNNDAMLGVDHSACHWPTATKEACDHMVRPADGHGHKSVTGPHV